MFPVGFLLVKKSKQLSRAHKCQWDNRSFGQAQNKANRGNLRKKMLSEKNSFITGLAVRSLYTIIQGVSAFLIEEIKDKTRMNH